jgi:hypothetical protein
MILKYKDTPQPVTFQPGGDAGRTKIYRALPGLACILLLCVCATAPEPPAWAFDTEAAWPQEKYIAQKGRGSDRQRAELSALENLSRYFVTEVRSATSAAGTYTEKDGVSSRSLSVDEQVFVQSQTKLFAVRYTEAWRPSPEEWETLAYIDRAEAWGLYEPGLRQKAEAFESAFRAAGAEKEPVKQLYLYSHCRSLSAELPPLLNFAEILYPPGAARYSGVGETIAGLSQKTDKARGTARIYIDCPVDFEGALSGALARAFEKAGLTPERDRASASAVCVLEVQENAQKQGEVVFYRPALTVTLEGKTGTLFTWNAAAERAGAFNAEVAKRRAYAGLVQKIDESFTAEFEKRMNSP